MSCHAFDQGMMQANMQVADSIKNLMTRLDSSAPLASSQSFDLGSLTGFRSVFFLFL